MSLGVILRPERALRGSVWPVARTLRLLPPTSTTRIFSAASSAGGSSRTFSFGLAALDMAILLRRPTTSGPPAFSLPHEGKGARTLAEGRLFLDEVFLDVREVFRPGQVWHVFLGEPPPAL